MTKYLLLDIGSVVGFADAVNVTVGIGVALPAGTNGGLLDVSCAIIGLNRKIP